MRPRRDDKPSADPQGAVARAETYGADHYDPIAEARLVERARIVRMLEALPGYHDDYDGSLLRCAVGLIEEGAHLDEVEA